jgi:16S rRNA (guanine527-N7)-methyltransferase
VTNLRGHLRQILDAGILALSLELNEQQREKLLDYLDLLQKWNGVYNLTAIRDPEQMLKQHILDCLAALPHFQAFRGVLDVGSGGGFPGMVLAIAYPQMAVALVDTVQKKTAFLTQAKAELGLGNVTVHTCRVENWRSEEKFEVITSRAFSDLGNFIILTNHLLEEDGCYLAMKGMLPEKEMAALPAGWMVTQVWPLTVPGLQAERHLLMLQRSH